MRPDRCRFSHRPGSAGPSVVWRAVPLAAALSAAMAAQAQSDPPQAPTPPVQKIEITGSLIKRINTETPLPMQVITREEIRKSGATNAAEIVNLLTAAVGNLTDGASIAFGGYRDQMGLNAANLRGLGPSSTLVLLNGRRMTNFASPGDDVGVDLNNIPAAAIEKVDVLLDGASARYGADAIGGVINFITRRDYQGFEASAQIGATGEGGAGKRTATFTAGYGDLATQRFNLFGVFDIQHTDALRTSQRKFIDDLKVPERLPHLLSSATFPGNIRLTSDQRDYLQSVGFTINGKPIVNRTINLSAPNCNPPASLYLPLGIGGEDACTFDYMRDVELYPESKKLSFLGRGVFQVNPDTRIFGELSYSRGRTYYVGTSNRIDGDVDVSRIPELAATGLGDALPDDRIITVRTRLLDAGGRKSELTSTGMRALFGVTGVVANWDYELGLSRSTNRVAEADVAGYLLYDQAFEGFANGLIDPFNPSTPEQRDFLKSIQVNEVVRSARGSTDMVDATVSRSLMTLAGGDLTLGLGGEFRREEVSSKASELLLSDNILGDSTPGDAQFTDASRKVAAVFAELDAPITQSLQITGAVRVDKYQAIGSTVNPKLGLKFSPTPAMLLRASAGTGFRAPSASDLFRPTAVGVSATLADPVCMAENDNDLTFCADLWETRTYSNPDLKPEKSTQFSFGGVFQVTPAVSFSVDYWNIAKRDIISTIGDEVILNNLDKYESLVHRYNEDEGLCDFDPDDSSICFIELRKSNRGREKVSGLDFVAEAKQLPLPLGQLGLRLAGTLTLTSKRQSGPGDPFISNLGKFVNDGAVQRWRHRATVSWDNGPWSVSLTNQFLSSYTDQNNAIDTDSGTVVEPNRVKAYSLWDVAGSWSPNPSLTLRAGIRNLLDTPPPFSNQAYYFISGYDPTYTDPRGRFFYVGLDYAMK